MHKNDEIQIEKDTFSCPKYFTNNILEWCDNYVIPYLSNKVI